MADEPEVIAEIPVVQPPPASEEPVSIEDDLPPDEGEEGAAEIVEDDTEEFDWEGKKVKGPKGLKDGVLRQADYTKKTQEIAATRKELDAERVKLAEQAKVSEEDLKVRASFIAKTEELEQYAKVDWDAWAQQDPMAAQQAFMRWQRLNTEVGKLKDDLQQRTQARASEAQRDFAKRLEETEEYARKNIKGWTPEMGRQVVEFAKEQGVDLPTLQSVMSPPVIKILNLARLGAELLNKPPAPKPSATVTPLETVGAKANPPARKAPEDMSMDEYVAWRKKGGGTRRA